MTERRTQAVHVKQEHDVYIGREMTGHPASAFANPFRIGLDGNRDAVIAKYEVYIVERLSKEPLLQEALAQLRTNRLGCWCKPARCHGDILVKLLEGEEPSPPQFDLF